MRRETQTERERYLKGESPKSIEEGPACSWDEGRVTVQVWRQSAGKIPLSVWVGFYLPNYPNCILYPTAYCFISSNFACVLHPLHSVQGPQRKNIVSELTIINPQFSSEAATLLSAPPKFLFHSLTWMIDPDIVSLRFQTFSQPKGPTLFLSWR